MFSCVCNTLGLRGPPYAPSLAELAQRREVIAQQIAQLGDLRPGCVTGTSGRCAKLSCGCHQPGEPAHGRHSNTVGRLVSNGEAMAWLGRLSPVSRMRRASRAIFCGLLPNLDNQAVYGGGNSFFLHYTCSGTTQGFR